MTFFEAAANRDYTLMYNMHISMTPLEKLFSFKLYKDFIQINFGECCGGEYSRYCKSQNPEFFQGICDLKGSLHLGDCGEWHEDIANTFPEYIKFKKELEDVKDHFKA